MTNHGDNRSDYRERTRGTRLQAPQSRFGKQRRWLEHHHVKALLTSGNRTITADLPLVASLVNGWHKLGQTSASRILDDIRRKPGPGWNLGTKAEILERVAANSVPLFHKTMMLLELKEGICTILEEWMKETPPLSWGLWTSLGRLPLRVFSIGKYAFQKKTAPESKDATVSQLLAPW
jgi:hypothetical protein